LRLSHEMPLSFPNLQTLHFYANQQLGIFFRKHYSKHVYTTKFITNAHPSLINTLNTKEKYEITTQFDKQILKQIFLKSFQVWTKL